VEEEEETGKRQGCSMPAKAFLWSAYLIGPIWFGGKQTEKVVG
jgi:hypothetical protein